ncbi:MAG TPA: DUF5818 domain-containing protein [Candidatus Acidoferrales bacterium]|nr:DUF5818 domain-containing protein [Candidatus Acidoferrales bacterium]
MLKRLMLCAAGILLIGGLSMAGQDAAKSGTWSGIVTNDKCGAKDASAAGAECSKGCIKNKGAKLALYDTDNKKVYVLEPQNKATGHEGHDVTVQGTLDGDTIHVTSITMNPAKGS